MCLIINVETKLEHTSNYNYKNTVLTSLPTFVISYIEIYFFADIKGYMTSIWDYTTLSSSTDNKKLII